MRKRKQRALKDLRKKEGVNQSEMAEKLGVSYSYYSKIECGERKASRGFLEKLKAYFPDFDINKVI